jgi:large subunit ribosomal protein L9
MEVILLEHISKLGGIGDVVGVKGGFGRNFLVPQGKALRATAANKKVFEARRAEIEAKNDELRGEALELAKKIDNAFVTFTIQAGEDGRLFGSVNGKNIASAVNEQYDAEVLNKHMNITSPIKYIGIYPVTLNLHADVEIKILVNVARSKAEAEETKAEFLKGSSPKKEDAQEEKVEEAINTTEEDNNDTPENEQDVA